MLTKDLENENEKRTTREWQYYAELAVERATYTYNRIREEVTKKEEQYAKDIAYLESCHLGLEDFTFNGVVISPNSKRENWKQLQEHFVALVDVKAAAIGGDNLSEEQKKLLTSTEVSKLNWQRNVPAAVSRIKLLLDAQSCMEQPQRDWASSFSRMPERIYVCLASAEYEVKKATLLRDLMLKE